MHMVWINLLIILPPVASVVGLSVERGSELFSHVKYLQAAVKD